MSKSKDPMRRDYHRRQEQRGDEGLALLLRVAFWICLAVIVWHWAS